MIPSDIKWSLSYGVLGCMFYLSVSPTVTGASSSLTRLFAKLGATEQQIKVPSYPVSTGSPRGYVLNNETSNNTTFKTDTRKRKGGAGSNNEAEAQTVTAAAKNETSTVQTSSTKMPEDNSSSVTNASLTTEELTTEYVRPTETTPKYILPKRTKPPSFSRNLIADVPERDGEDEAIVETRPYLLHPLFTTYMLIVTLPCVIGWCLLTFVCLWICRPNSPLYREILKRLIEHSQMKQKSVLFSATVLAADKQPAAPPSTTGTTGEGTPKA